MNYKLFNVLHVSAVHFAFLHCIVFFALFFLYCFQYFIVVVVEKWWKYRLSKIAEIKNERINI